MESYLVKVSLCLIILYGAYRLMLRYEVNHQLNRFIGLTCILFSATVPLAQFKDLLVPTQLSDPFYFVAKRTVDFHQTVSSTMSDNTINIVLFLYAIGVSVYLLRYLVGLAKLLTLYLNSPKSCRWGFTIVSVGADLSPFTFFNVLFIGNNRIEDSEMETIVLHERAHREQYHSIDTILLEALTIMFWFNPTIWLFRRDIKAEHEYFADRRVLQNGINPIDYQLMLFKAQTGASIDLGNYLSGNASLIKRFSMMTKTRSKLKSSYLRICLFIALMSVILFLGAFSGRTEEAQIDKIATYEQGEEAMYQTISKRITYPASARRENRSGLVRVSFTVNENGNVERIESEKGKDGYLLKEIVVIGWSESSQKAKGIDDALKAAAIQCVEGLGNFIPAQKDGKPVSCVLTLPIKFKVEQK